MVHPLTSRFIQSSQQYRLQRWSNVEHELERYVREIWRETRPAQSGIWLSAKLWSAVNASGGRKLKDFVIYFVQGSLPRLFEKRFFFDLAYSFGGRICLYNFVHSGWLINNKYDCGVQTTFKLKKTSTHLNRYKKVWNGGILEHCKALTSGALDRVNCQQSLVIWPNCFQNLTILVSFWFIIYISLVFFYLIIKFWSYNALLSYTCKSELGNF